MTDLPTEVRVINTWEDIDRALLAMRVAEAKIAEVSAQFDQEIQAAQEAKNKNLSALTARRERMEALVEAWVRGHREDLKGKKSLKMVHGKVGFRVGKLALQLGSSEAHTIKLLKIRGHAECIVVKEEVDKAALKNLPPTELALCDITQTRTERFFCNLSSDPPIVYPDAAAEEGDHGSPTSEA